MIDFKVSIPGKDVNVASLLELSVSSQLDQLKCDLRPSPKHYGLINFNIANIPPVISLGVPSEVVIFQIAHGYNYIPSYLTSWNYPAGTAGSLLASASNATFGVGDIDASLSNGPYIAMYTDNTNFTVVAQNFQSSNQVNINGTIKFYIFANDFPRALFSDL